MTAAPLPTEQIDATDALLGRARRFILGMVDIVRARMERPRRLTAKTCRALLAEFVAPAEAALRRAILIIAAGLPMPEFRPRPRPPPAAAPSPDGPITRAAPQHPRPVFRLSEPVPQAAALRPVPARDPAAPISRASPDPYAAQGVLLRRLEALQLAAADPMREAERWRRRQPPATAAAAEPALPLDFFGLPETWLHLPGELVLLLIELNAAALTACLPDTS